MPDGSGRYHDERVVRAVAAMLAVGPRQMVPSGKKFTLEWSDGSAFNKEAGPVDELRAETDGEYASRLARAGLEALKGGGK